MIIDGKGKAAPAAPAVPAAELDTTANVSAAQVAEIINDSDSSAQELLRQLVSVLLMKEGRAAKEDNLKEFARQAKETQRAKNAQSLIDGVQEKQKRCKHLKGGKGPRTAAVDYSVYMHMYINAERVIRCTLCRAAWKQGDTRDILVRNGRKMPNPTGLSWNDATKMLNQTTNRPSSSEVPVVQTPVVQQLPIGAGEEE